MVNTPASDPNHNNNNNSLWTFNTIVFTVLFGIVATLAGAAIIWALGIIPSTLPFWFWPLVIVSGIVLAVIILQFIYARTQAERYRLDSENKLKLLAVSQQSLAVSQQSLAVSQQLIDLNDEIVKLLPNLFHPINGDRRAAMNDLLNKVLADISDLLGIRGLRASVLVPDERNEYLTYIGWYRISHDPLSLIEKRFHISGNMDEDRGLPGWTFVTGGIEKGKLTHTGRYSSCDNPRYTFHPNKRRVNYDSIITLPIKAPEKGAKTVGVLCFDSTDITAFDSAEILEVLEKFSLRLYAPIIIYNNLC